MVSDQFQQIAFLGIEWDRSRCAACRRRRRRRSRSWSRSWSWCRCWIRFRRRRRNRRRSRRRCSGWRRSRRWCWRRSASAPGHRRCDVRRGRKYRAAAHGNLDLIVIGRVWSQTGINKTIRRRTCRCQKNKVLRVGLRRAINPDAGYPAGIGDLPDQLNLSGGNSCSGERIPTSRL